MEKRDTLKVWTLLLAILAFYARHSAVLTVHFHASSPGCMPSLGIPRAALVLASPMLGGALRHSSPCARSSEPGGLFAPVSRRGAALVLNLLLASAPTAVLIGTLYPLALEPDRRHFPWVRPSSTRPVCRSSAPLLLRASVGKWLHLEEKQCAGRRATPHNSTGPRDIPRRHVALRVAWRRWARCSAPLGAGLGVFLIPRLGHQGGDTARRALPRTFHGRGSRSSAQQVCRAGLWLGARRQPRTDRNRNRGPAWHAETSSTGCSRRRGRRRRGYAH